MKQVVRSGWVMLAVLFLASCGFHLQGPATLAPPLHRLYLQTPDPYGSLARHLKQILKTSNVELVDSPSAASAVLVILRDDTSQEFLGVNGTIQTRQYNLRVTVVFEVTDPSGHPLIGPQTLSEARAYTVQSNQILGSSNQENLFYQQMRRTLAYAMINRLASQELTQLIDTNSRLKTNV